MLTVSMKVLLILFLAGVIGWDREKHGRPAGFRTHILVGIGSTIIMIVSIMLFEHYPEADADPGRIAAQVVSGIGFLGAGTILIQGSIVKGLTTAASLWATAAIGLAVGGGFYFVGIIATFVVFISLFFFSSIEYGKTKIVTQQLLCRIDGSKKEIYNVLYQKLQGKDCEIKTIRTRNDYINNELIVDCKLEITSDVMSDLNNWLTGLDEVNEVTWIEV
ncbi:MAG: MgtC/SapB family protein [Halanaerobiales bacterium]